MLNLNSRNFIEPHLEDLAKIASWYYEEDVDQSTIAKRIGKSRSMVSRLLREARERGLVDIRVNWPLRRDIEIEKKLCETFGLEEAWVLSSASSDYQTLLRGIGELGALCLQQYLHDGINVGIGWGHTLHEVVRAIPVLPYRGGAIVQIIGALGHGDPIVEGAELARWLANKVGASYRALSAPLIVENAAIANALSKERSILEILEMGRNVDVAMVGVGAVDPDVSGLFRTGYLTQDEVSLLIKMGCVGDLLARHLDENGNELEVSLNQRVVGLNLKSLKGIPKIICVGGGPAKVKVIRASLLGRHFNILVTDSTTARAVLGNI